MRFTVPYSRRAFIKQGSRLLAAGSLIPWHQSIAQSTAQPAFASRGLAPQELARNESYWAEVAAYYDRTEGIVNLEHGYWGKMANPVKDYYLEASNRINQQNSYYARRNYGEDHERSVAAVADALGVAADEIALTRNASEAIQNLIRQYQNWQPGDKVLYADIDYPAFKNLVQWLEEGRGVSVIRLDLPARCDQNTLRDLYIEAMDANPELKMLLLTHVSNQHGLRLPVSDIAQAARERGIDVVCDAAQSWGLVDFQIPDLNVDWAGFNLHKWIGAPVGVGALYMRRGTADKVSPFPGDADRENNRVAARVHTATSNFAAMISVTPALEFHQRVGERNKEERLKYLASLWRDEASTISGIEVLGPADAESATGLGAFRLSGQTSAAQIQALQKQLESQFGIFTVARYGLASGACIRVTPQVFSTPQDMIKLKEALQQLA
jgi:selenocysteine lyase/cysteine desulfurase